MDANRPPIHKERPWPSLITFAMVLGALLVSIAGIYQLNHSPRPIPKQNATTPTDGPVPVVQAAPPPASIIEKAPRDGRCIDGQLFRKSGNEWLQLDKC